MQRRISLFVSLFLLFFIANVTLASGGRRRASGNGERLEGVVTAASADQLTVRTATADRDVKLNSSTVVKLNGQKSTTDTIQAGDKVEVKASKGADGTLTALEVDVENDMDVTGVVQSISATELTITTKNGDATFTLTEDTVVLLHGVRTSTDTIKVGDKVEVHWVAGDGDTRVARMINLHTDVKEVEGIVTEISDTSMTVQPHQGGDPVIIAITPDTVVRFAERQTNVDTIRVGSKVEVKTLLDANGVLTALFVEVHNPNDLDEIKGVVTAVGTDSITVDTGTGDPVVITVNGDTIVRVNGQTASLSDVKVGDKVEVDATSDGTTFTAVRINVENDDERFTEVKGSVTTLTGSVLTVQTKNGPVDVSLTSSTTFRGGSVADLTPGTEVEITAKRNSDDSLEALNVEIEESHDDHGGGSNNAPVAELKGTIKTVDANSIALDTRSGAITVSVDSSTVVQNGKKKGSVSDLEAGQKVEIKAQRKADNSLLAKLIKIDD